MVEQIGKMKRLGIIEESSSMYNAPVVLVPKGDQWRMCNDFRRLNDVTIAVVLSMPTVDDVIERLARAEFFSKFDCTSAYFQLRIRLEDRCKTAFRCHEGTFQYVVCPFGLKNLPAEFNKAVSTLFGDLKEIMDHFFDDFAVFSEGDFDTHLDAVDKVLSRCGAQVNMTLSMEKSIVGRREIPLLGSLVSKNSVRLADKGLRAIQRLKRPTSAKEVLHVLGLLGFWRHFIWGFSQRAGPLLEKLKPGRPGCGNGGHGSRRPSRI